MTLSEEIEVRKDTLNHVLAIIASKQAVKRTADYLAGGDAVKLAVEAAIEGLEIDGDMYISATTQL